MNQTIRGLVFFAALLALPAWANHHGGGSSGGSSSGSVTPDVCVAWGLDDGGVTDGGQYEYEQTDAGTVVDVLPCVQTEPVGCSSTTGSALIGLAALVIVLQRRRRPARVS